MPEEGTFERRCSGAIAGCMTFVFAAVLLAYASVAQGQITEEGRQGGDHYGESFSLSCPPRLVVRAGSSVALSCAAAGVPEEGVRYEWESLSGEGFNLLSASDRLSPLFTAPVREENAEYAYRLTATGPGVYATASVTVSAESVPGASVGTPVIQEDCDSFTLPGEFGETCLEDKGPTPFGVEPEEEFLFPEAPGIPDPPFGPDQGGGFESRTPPRLECPAAVFLEEMETGAIACRAWDASGEEYLEYEWAPAGGTTRDYLDNPRLIPEDSPNPAVIAPEAPARETLDSFLSGDRALRYRYRLTATSRATGLSSHEEVEVYVSSNRPGVYCPLEVTVAEGETVALDCEGVDPLSTRMDYDEKGASILWEWEGLWGTSTAPLDATDRSSPLFTAPPGSAGDEYHYIASMVSSASGTPRTARRKVTIRVAGEPGTERTAKAVPVITCEDQQVYETAGAFRLNCSVTDRPANPVYLWEARGDTPDTERLSRTNILRPVFDPPDSIPVDTDYEYRVTLSASGIDNVTEDITISVWSKVRIICEDNPYEVDEGAADFELECDFDRRPFVSWSWSPTTNLTDYNTGTPVFHVPDDVRQDTRYAYMVTAADTAIVDDNLDIESSVIEVTVTVRNTDVLAPSISCVDTEVYEDAADITLDCTVTSAPSDAAYSWEARSGTADIRLLSSTRVLRPTFDVPGNIDANTDYAYTVTLSASGIDNVTEDVTVTVLDKPSLTLACADPGSVYEGSEDIVFDCSVSGAPDDDAQYAYLWTARGDTPDTALLSATDIVSPTFYVPDEVDANETYEYLLTVSAENAEDGSAEVTVTVLDKPALAVACADPGSVYEGSEDVVFDCSVSGAPDDDAQYAYLWTARGDTPDTALLSATDIVSPTFYVPDEVDANETYEYLLTVSAENAENGSAEVTVLDKPALAVACADPGSVYEGSEDVVFDCSVSGAPDDDAQYAYLWTARGDTPDTALLSATDIVSPTFYVPDDVDENETYDYLLTVSAENAENGSAEVTVTVLDRVEPLLSDPSALGVTASVSALRFGVQSTGTEVALDPVTDRISAHAAGPYHSGRMTLSPGGSELLNENGEMDLSIELASPVVLRREGSVETASIVLSPVWSMAASCEQLSSRTMGGLYAEATLSEDECLLLRFGGDLDLADASWGRYTGGLDVILRSGDREEIRTVEVTVTVVPVQRAITIGPGGVRFDASQELPVGLTEEQNLGIYPDIAFLTEEKPHGVFELSNPSLVPLEISLSTRFGYTEATETGREVLVEDASESRLGDLSETVDIHPDVLVLQPSEKGLIRYGVSAETQASMSDRGYAAFFDIASVPRQYVRSDRMPEEVTGERTARVTMRVPGVYVPGNEASQLRATLLSVSYAGATSATFLVETLDRPFVGEVVAYDGNGRELGRRETLVYTRSRVRIPLDRIPEEEAVFLRFFPRESDRAPLPASVEWNAPERDMGDAGEKGRTEYPASSAAAGY